jgi:anaerobic dimethyl sulfoxide reductase subunit A
MSKLIEKLANGKISRRDFLKGSAVATAAVAGLSLAGCQSSSVEDTTAAETTTAAATEATTEAAVSHPESDDVESQGKWITASCWHNCGGRCLNKALVVDGVVVRQKTDDTHEDTPDYPQQRACVRGRAQRQHVFSPDRLKYPMKRKNWQPGDGEKHPELRGKDEWERITWDEAIEMCADEIHRILQANGPESVLIPGGGECMMLLSKLGGYRTCWGTNSRGAYTSTPGKCGFWPQANEGINDRIELRNSDIVILHACNPAWSSAGNPAYHLMQIKKYNPNAEFICIDPMYTDSAALMDAEWIPCRPSTDIAFLIGLAHTVYTLDEAGEGLMDWDFLNTHALGFDQDHMPEDAEEGAPSFKEYLLGEVDGVVKDAAWASNICGIPVEKFEHLAKKIGKDNKVAYLTAWAPARTHNADNLPQMVMTLGAMTGHYGKSGHCWGVSAHSRNINGGYYFVGAGGAGNPSAKNPLENASLNDTETWAACKKGEYIYNYYGAPGVKMPIDLKMVYWGYSSFLQTRDGATAGIEVIRSLPEFVLCQALFRTTNAKYSDIVLPAVTPWEKEGSFLQGNREALIMATKVTEPLYEAKNDQEIVNLIAAKIKEKYGDSYPELTDEPLYPLDEKQQFMNQAAGAWYFEPNSKEKKTLITITKEQKAEYGVEGDDQEGVITFEEFMEKGLYQIPRSAGDGYDYIAWEDFQKDPSTNAAAANSASGKMEIYCQGLKDMVNAMMFSNIEAYPTYIAPEDGYDNTWKDGVIGGEKGEFPLQVYNPHYLRRSHSDFDNVGWLREAWPNPVFISTEDAESIGVKDGETVQVTSPHGTTLRNACVTARIMPGVVALPHGSWIDVDESNGIDKGGADNILCGGISTGAGVSGWNTGRCNIRKYTGKQLPADVDRSDMQERILFD